MKRFIILGLALGCQDPAQAGALDDLAKSLDMAAPADMAMPLGPPSLSMVNPAVGPSAGGISVVITGQNFAPGATVTFGGKAAPQVTVNSTTQLTVTLPAMLGTSGPV